MDNYKVYLDNDHRFKLVDVREPIDIAMYKGYTNLSMKRVIKASCRNAYSPGRYNLQERDGVYGLTYPNGDFKLVAHYAGDYIPPGYNKISRELTSILSSYTTNHRQCKEVNRVKIIPLHSMLLNPRMESRRGTMCVGRGYSEDNTVVGWSFYHNRTDQRYIYIDMCRDGMKCRAEDTSVLASQYIRKELLVGKTRIRIRCVGATVVMLGDVALEPADDSIFIWEGEEFTQDTRLIVPINSDNFISNVEILND